ncbi:MAG: prolyl oligopeptidase family serine peptidase [Bryobacteraceae bacterium]|nr:prolyl oligopeptidase family serine peptidase [Bryobacteraceae bacterium]
MRLAIALLLAPAIFAQAPQAQPPQTKSAPVTDTMHGVSITDPYRWLEDQNSPETRAWVDAQMRYTKQYLAKAANYDAVKKRFMDLMNIETMGAPRVAGGRYFFAKRKPGQRQSVWYVREGWNGKDEVLIDPNPWSPDATLSASLLDISNDGKLVAYGVRKGGEDEVEVRFLEVDGRKELGDRMPRARYSGVGITNDRKHIYYSKFTPEGPRIYHHPLNTGEHHMIFGEKYNAGHILGCSISEDGKWLQIGFSQGSSGRNELYLKDLTGRGPIQPVISGIDAHFDTEVHGDRVYALTDWKAPNGRVLVVDLKNPAQDQWKELIAEGKSRLESMSIVGGKLFTNTLENVQPKIRMFSLDGRMERELEHTKLGTVSTPSGRADSGEAFYSFSTFGEPGTIYRYNVKTGERAIWSQTRIPFDSSTVQVEQVWYNSKDGTRVPMFLAYKKGLKRDGSNPAMLTGYGGFNLVRLPAYAPLSTVWMEMGGVWAVANLRGGGEFGEEWHKAGMFEKKQNVFDDFIAAAEYLVNQKYTRKDKLAISGGSNGGLLVGAAMTQRPDLFGAVICSVPLLDMVRYDKFLVARYWIPEYGSASDPKQFPYIFKYSPYHRVEKGAKYPAVMFVSGDADTRVDPLHVRKMAAMMQASTGSDKPVLLHYDTKAGHSTGLPVDRQAENLADEIAFLTLALGLN